MEFTCVVPITGAVTKLETGAVMKLEECVVLRRAVETEMEAEG